MDLGFISDMFIPVVMAACLVAGYIIKKWLPTDNKWIPTVCCVLGMILACVANQQVSLQAIVSGAVTGLASTGLHQAFKQIIEGGRKDE